MKFCSRKIFSFRSDVNSYGDSRFDLRCDMVRRLGTKIAGSRIRSSVSLNNKVRHATTVVVHPLTSFSTSWSFSTRFTTAFPHNPTHISPSIRATVWTTQQFAPPQQQILLHDPRTQNFHPYSIQPNTLHFLCVHLIRLSPKYFSRILIFRYLYLCPFLNCHFATASLCGYR